MKKYLKWICFVFLCFLGITVYVSAVQTRKHNRKSEALSANPVIISHALGEIEGKKYTNSFDALEASYQNGCRIFETDIQITSDNVLILRHDWTKTRGQEGLLKEKGYIPTYEEFMSIPFYEKYTPLSLADLFVYMKTHEDMYVITDTKLSKYDDVVQQFELIVQTAKEAGARSCLDRLIIQIYNDKMLTAVKSVYPFKDFIYTVYKRGTDNFEELCQFCVKNKIPIVTMDYKKYKDEYLALIKQYHLKLFLHTINDSEKARSFYDKGVNGFYTDELTPTDFR